MKAFRKLTTSLFLIMTLLITQFGTLTTLAATSFNNSHTTTLSITSTDLLNVGGVLQANGNVHYTFNIPANKEVHFIISCANMTPQEDLLGLISRSGGNPKIDFTIKNQDSSNTKTISKELIYKSLTPGEYTIQLFGERINRGFSIRVYYY